MKYKKTILGIILLAIIVAQTIMTLGVYVSLKYQIDDPTNELSGYVVSNVHEMIGTLSTIIGLNWVIIIIMFIMVIRSTNGRKQ